MQQVLSRANPMKCQECSIINGSRLEKDERKKLSTAMTPPVAGQLRCWDDHVSGLFLIINVQDDFVIIADGSRIKTYDHKEVTNFSSISDLTHIGELRIWNGSFTSPRTFVIIDVKATKKGALLCDLLDEGKIVRVSLGSMLMMSEPAT
jgi:hypothetical protein